jgi:hypothetical protein
LSAVPLLTSSEIYDWCYPRRRERVAGCWQWSVYRILREIAEPIRKVPPHNAWLWRLRNTEPGE